MVLKISNNKTTNQTQRKRSTPPHTPNNTIIIKHTQTNKQTNERTGNAVIARPWWIWSRRMISCSSREWKGRAFPMNERLTLKKNTKNRKQNGYTITKQLISECTHEHMAELKKNRWNRLNKTVNI